MRYCWTGYGESGTMHVPGIIFLGALCIGSIFKEAFQSSNPAYYLLITSILFLILWSWPIYTAYISARKYQIDSDGMTLRYPFGLKRRYNWHEFSEIALCKVHYAAGSHKHTQAIRCVVGDEKNGPQFASTSREHWSSEFYELIHFRTIISIYYSEERYMEFLEKCPCTIGDYRHLKDGV